MTDPLRDPDTEPDDRAAAPGVPSWVKISVIIVAILALALIAIMLLSGGGHGPSRHATGGQPAGHTAGQVRGNEAPGGRP